MHSHFKDDYRNAIVYKINSKVEYHIVIHDTFLNVEYKIGDTTLIHFKDILKDKENLSTFKRTIKNQEFHFKDGEFILKKEFKSVKMFSKLEK